MINLALSLYKHVRKVICVSFLKDEKIINQNKITQNKSMKVSFPFFTFSSNLILAIDFFPNALQNQYICTWKERRRTIFNKYSMSKKGEHKREQFFSTDLLHSYDQNVLATEIFLYKSKKQIQTFFSLREREAYNVGLNQSSIVKMNLYALANIYRCLWMRMICSFCKKLNWI